MCKADQESGNCYDLYFGFPGICAPPGSEFYQDSLQYQQVIIVDISHNSKCTHVLTIAGKTTYLLYIQPNAWGWLNNALHRI